MTLLNNLILFLWNVLTMPFKLTWLCPWCPDSVPVKCPGYPRIKKDLTNPLMSLLCLCEMPWLCSCKMPWLCPWCPYCAPVKCPDCAPVKCPDCAPGNSPDYAPGENWPDREPVVVMQGGERVKWLKGPQCRRTYIGRGPRFLLSSLFFLPPFSCKLE